MVGTTEATVWHYTDAHGLIGIVQGTFHASSTITLNDTSEVEYGLGVFREVWASLDQEQIPERAAEVISSVLGPDGEKAISLDVFLICASRKNDSLNQWQGYAGKQGYALGVATATPMGMVVAGTPPEAVSMFVPSDWYDVVYDRDSQKEMALDALNFSIDEVRKYAVEAWAQRVHLITMIGAIAPRFKHHAFADEQEVRFICVKPTEIPEKFRVGGRGLVPYVEIAPTPTEITNIYAAATHAKLPITSVRCGPNGSEKPDPGTVESVRRLLSRNGYSAPVDSSDIPYRP
jgi:hypothetical protein